MATSTQQYIQQAVQETLEERERAFKSAIKGKITSLANIQSQILSLQAKFAEEKKALHAMKLEEFDSSLFN